MRRAAPVLALALVACARAELLLRCCVVIEAPFIYVDADEKLGYAGATIEYYKLLRDAVKPDGFRCVAETGVDGPETFVEYGGGFNMLVDHFAACATGAPGLPTNDTTACDCDIGTISAARNTDRNGKVDFVAPMFFDALALVQRTDALEEGGNSLFFLAPFSSQVWLGVASLVILHVFVTLFDRNFVPTNEAYERPAGLSRLQKLRYALMKTGLLRRIRYAFFVTTFGLVGHVNDTPEAPGRQRPTTLQRMLVLFAILLGTFLVLV